MLSRVSFVRNLYLPIFFSVKCISCALPSVLFLPGEYILPCTLRNVFDKAILEWILSHYLNRHFLNVGRKYYSVYILQFALFCLLPYVYLHSKYIISKIYIYILFLKLSM